VGSLTFSVHPHNAKRKYAHLLWYADWRAVGPRGRRHDRRNIAWMLGWNHQQNEVESGDDVSPCPWTKRTYRRHYEAGRKCWSNCNGGHRG